MRTLLLTAALAMAATSLSAQDVKPVAEDYSTRQVHLDFHTNGEIEGIGAQFNKQDWQKKLQDSKVESINIFAKGHNGYSYYPTKVGTSHPHLQLDLMGAQIEACHEIGVKCPIYFPVGWSLLDAVNHPEWRILDRDGHPSSYYDTRDVVNDNDPFPYNVWDLLMPEGAYLDVILAQTEELCKNYDVDGFWFDIIPTSTVNFSESSRAEMAAQGIDIDNEADLEKFHVAKIRHFMESCNEIVKRYHPEASIFYNWSTHLNQKYSFTGKLYKYNTSFDLEDLPTTWDGYNQFPMRAKFFSNEGKPITGMSGKFHTSWGEFGGFKYPNAMKYEAAAMVAFGANVNYGDQLHPCGLLDDTTYENIQKTYDYIESIEEYGVGGENISNVGLWLTFDNYTEQSTSLLLLDTQTNYEVVNNLEDWSSLDVIIVPSIPCIDAEAAERFNAFLKRGGKVIMLGEGALNASRDGFALDVDAEYIGGPSYDCDYTMVGDAISENVVKTPFLNYNPAYRVKIGATAEVLAGIKEPYFSRTKAHYSSHRNTPNRLEMASHPAVFRSGNIYIATHPLDVMYREHGAQVHREIFNTLLNTVCPEKMVETEMPSAGRVNLLKFSDKSRYVVHLLYGSPIQRGEAQIIDDLPAIYNTPVELRVDEKIKRAYIVGSNKKLKFSQKNGVVKVNVPEFSCHTAIVFEY